MIALMGAAGHVGGKVADLLLTDGEDIRILEHTRELDELKERGARVIRGDAVDIEALQALFDGADAALVLLPENVSDPQFVATRSGISRALVHALREQSVGHVVALSAAGADLNNMVGPPAALREYEQALFSLDRSCALVLRSAFYIDYLLASLPMIQAQHLNGAATAADVAFPMIATQDVAHEAAARLLLRGFSGHGAKLLLGPQDLSMRHATHAIGEALGLPDLPYAQFPPDQVRGALIGAACPRRSPRCSLRCSSRSARADCSMAWSPPENTTPTTLGEFLNTALAEVSAR